MKIKNIRKIKKNRNIWKIMKNKKNRNIRKNTKNRKNRKSKKTLGKLTFSWKIIAKPLENKYFHRKSLENLRKTNNFIEKHYKTTKNKD